MSRELDASCAEVEKLRQSVVTAETTRAAVEEELAAEKEAAEVQFSAWTKPRPRSKPKHGPTPKSRPKLGLRPYHLLNLCYVQLGCL